MQISGVQLSGIQVYEPGTFIGDTTSLGAATLSKVLTRMVAQIPQQLQLANARFCLIHK